MHDNGDYMVDYMLQDISIRLQPINASQFKFENKQHRQYYRYMFIWNQLKNDYK